MKYPAQTPALVKNVTQLLSDKKAIDLRVLDLRGLASYTDFMVLASANSEPHVNSMVSILRDSKSGLEKPAYISSSKDGSWWILDFVDVVVHVLKQDLRAYYDLEGLWNDAKAYSVE